MSIKTILLPRDSAELSGELLDASLAVARLFAAHLEVLLLRRDPEHAMPFVFSTLSSGKLRKTITEAVQQGENERASEIRQRFGEFCARHAIPVIDTPDATQTVSAAWREGEDDALIRRGRLVDLIIAPRPAGKGQPTTLETVLLETQRPVLMLPPQAGTGTGIARKVVIGWNDSAEAAQAVTAALPFLRKAETITVLCSQKREASARELIEYLAWHKVAAGLKIFQVRSKSVGETLLDEAKQLQADLMVIGAYSHTRARQLLFGGVTQHILAHAHLPILMAH